MKDIISITKFTWNTNCHCRPGEGRDKIPQDQEHMNPCISLAPQCEGWRWASSTHQHWTDKAPWRFQTTCRPVFTESSYSTSSEPVMPAYWVPHPDSSRCSFSSKARRCASVPRNLYSVKNWMHTPVQPIHPTIASVHCIALSISSRQLHPPKLQVFITTTTITLQ